MRGCVQDMPQPPPLVVFFLHITPLFIHVALTRHLHVMTGIVGDRVRQKHRIDMGQRVFFFLSVEQNSRNTGAKPARALSLPFFEYIRV